MNLIMAFLALLLCSSASSEEPIETREGPGESLAAGNDTAWDSESRDGEWFLFKAA